MIAFDTETELMGPCNMAPRLVCVSLFDGVNSKLLDAREGLEWFQEAIQDQTLIGFNAPYDLAVFCAADPDLIPLVFKAHDEGRILDGLTRAKLEDVRTGYDRKAYSLADLVSDFFGENVEGKHGPDAWREHYGELIDVPIYPRQGSPIIPSQIGFKGTCWPEEAIRYAREDAVYHWRVWTYLENRGDLPDLEKQTYKAWWLHLMGIWGVETDPIWVEELSQALEARVLHLVDELTTSGLYRPETWIPTWGKNAGKVTPSQRCSLCGETNPRSATCSVSVPGVHLFRTKKDGFKVCKICNKDSGPCKGDGTHKLTRANPGSEDRRLITALVEAAYDGTPPLTKPSKTNPITCLTCGAVGSSFDKAPDECPDCENASGGQVSMDADTLLGSGDPDLMKLGSVKADYRLIRESEGKASKIQRLRWGVLHPSWNAVVNTGRTSCRQGRYGDQVQNPERKPGLRECYRAREGFVFIDADFYVAEMISFAQVQFFLFGSSALGETILAGQDPHIRTAAGFLGISYEDAKARYDAKDPILKGMRQLAKPFNFGKPGGMGNEKFYTLAQGQLADEHCLICHGTGHLRGGVSCSCLPIQDFTKEKCKEFGDLWLETYPESKQYFRHISRSLQLWPESGMTINQFVSNRIRGRVGYTDGCNTFFQGLTADGGNEAMIRVSRACYTDRSSPLYGCRPWNWVHDQAITEAREEIASEAAEELERLMVEGMRSVLPDMAPAVKCDAALMRRWRKSAEAVRVNGRLIPYEDRPLKEEEISKVIKVRETKGLYAAALAFGLELGRVGSL